MSDTELVTIGRFARISGLSVHALRHYDSVGLLTPAEVDPQSGYRRYRRDQVRQARLIHALRRVDLPIEDVRLALASEGEPLSAILRRQHERLLQRKDVVAEQIADIEYYLQKGLSMTPITANRPMQLKIAVDDVDEAIAFYQQAFAFHHDVTRSTDDIDYPSFVFSKDGDGELFLLHLLDESQFDRPGHATFGVEVDDVDAAHGRALAAGGTEIVAPQEPEGARRTSAVRDPSGNWVWIYQA